MSSASPLRAREILRLATQILLRTLHVFRIRLLATVGFGQQILDAEVDAGYFVFIDLDRHLRQRLQAHAEFVPDGTGRLTPASAGNSDSTAKSR